MPIDWEAIVSPFRPAFQSQTKYITESVREIGRWLNKRLGDARTQEQVSRAYPVIDFSGGAVQASVALFQQHSLGLPKQTGGARPTDEYLSAWQRFGRGFQRIPDAVEEALAIPRVVRLVEEILETIVASIERWEKPDWRMFDTKQPRRFSDLFGQIFFFAEMLSMSVDPIRVVLNSEIAKLMMAPSKSESPSSSSSDTLAQVVQYMVSALLLLPVGGMWIASLVRWGILSLKVAVLNFLTGIEDQIYTMRRHALEFAMGGLVKILDKAYLFIEGTKALLSYVIFRILSFGTSVLMAFTSKFRSFLFGVSRFLLRAGLLMTHILGALDGVMKINVVKIYTYGVFSGTVQDLVDFVTKKGSLTSRVVRFAVRKLAERLADLYDRSVLNRVAPVDAKKRVELIDQLFGVLQRTPKSIPNVSLPDAASAFPDVSAWLTTLNTVDLAGSLKATRATLETRLPAILDSAGDALDKMADELAASAGGMAAIGPLSDVTRVRDFADGTAAMLFGDQEQEIRQRLKRDGVAAAFDRAVAGGGFHIVGAAIPLYVESMHEFWEQKTAKAASALPTSPHILARRQRLGRVHVPAIRIRTSGRSLDDPLISRVAAEFRRAVQGAWTKGLQVEEAGA